MIKNGMGKRQVVSSWWPVGNTGNTKKWRVMSGKPTRHLPLATSH